jgi:uncharacterized protein HemX
MSDSESVTSTTSASTAPAAPRIGSRNALALAVGAAVALALVAAVVFGVLWGTASADLRNAQAELLDAQTELSDVQSKLADAEGEATDAVNDLYRDARYTACAKFYAGFAIGSGLDATSAARYALDTCADESAWEFVMDTAPEG